MYLNITQNVHPIRRAAIAAMLLLIPVVAHAAPDPSLPVDPKKDSSPAEALADRQAVVRDRVSRLEDRMFQLSQALRKSDPDKAGRLLESLGALRGKGIRQRIDEIVDKLRTEQYADAVDAQHEIADDLQTLLRMLLEDPDNMEQRKEEIKRLEELRKALDNIIEEQAREKAAAEAARAAENRAALLEAAAKELSELLQRQRSAAQRTQRDGGSLAEAANDQAGIRGRTEAVAKDVESVAEAEANTDAEADVGEGASSAGSGGEPDPRQASKSLDDAMEKMESAEQALRKADAPEAKQNQVEAAKALEEALDNIEKKAEKIRNKLKLDKQAAEQRETADKTDTLSNDMQSGGSEGNAGDQGGDKKGAGQKKNDQGGSQQSSQDTPGQDSVEQAVPLQQEAADKLDEENSDAAVEKQKEALDKLNQAKNELDDRLEQLRKEQQEEFLAALESRFRAMLGRQLECNKATTRLGELGTENWKRSDQLELAELSQKQRWVGQQADEAYFLLVEEGTTVILPTLVEQVRDDATHVADRLAAADAGMNVRMTQADLEQVLRDIIDAIKKKQEELDSEGGGGGGGGNSPLLPGSAELKLLRACQVRVNLSTERLQVESEDANQSPDEITRALKRLSKRQADVAEMAKDMHEALKKAQ